MSREILEAMGALAREKGISADKLRHALEDALLSAYKKQPGAARYAVKVPASANRNYWIEYRQPIGFDSFISTTPNSDVSQASCTGL